MNILLFLSCTSSIGDTSNGYSNVYGRTCSGEEPSGIPTGEINCSNGRCLVPTGAFWMGSTLGEADECPLREVALDQFSIDEKEVSIEQWESCQASGECEAIPEHCQHELENRVDYSTEFPAVCITWEQAEKYCQSVGGRLPTEAEWEKASRGESGANFAWGNLSPDCLRANFRLATYYCAIGVLPVGSHDYRSAYGLWDTVGNVWEWTADYYDAGYYQDAPMENPQGSTSGCQLTVDGPPQDCSVRVMRGGAFNTTEDVSRGSARSFGAVTLVDVNIGLRCAYD
jgi:formylglycine-generating enzyme required for sulfatase activity